MKKVTKLALISTLTIYSSLFFGGNVNASEITKNNEESSKVTIYKKKELTDIDSKLKLAEKQEGKNYIDIKGEKIPISNNDNDATIKENGNALSSDVDVSTSNEILEVTKSSDGEISAEIATTTIIEGDELDKSIDQLNPTDFDAPSSDTHEKITTEESSVTGTNQSNYKNFFGNLLSQEITPANLEISNMAKWTDKEKVGKYNSDRGVYISLTIYYHYQTKFGDKHVDMNYVKETHKVKKGYGFGSVLLRLMQRGNTQYGFFSNKYSEKSYTFWPGEVDVPDAWAPISLINGKVGGDMRFNYYVKGKKYSLKVSKWILDNFM